MSVEAYAKLTRPSNVSLKVNAACPGYTKTNLNNDSGTQTLKEGAREPVPLALLGQDGPTGTFSNSSGPLWY